MKYFPIFALFLLFACCEETNPIVQCVCVEQFSDALPIQIWPNDCNTYNETDPEGVHYKCFCQPWKCDLPIPVNFRETFDPSEVVTEESEEAISLPPLSNWLTQSSDPDLYDWTTGATPSVTLPGTIFPINFATSEYLYTSYAFIPGRQYTITVSYTWDVGETINTFLRILDSGFNVLFSKLTNKVSGTDSIVLTFTATAQSTYIAFRATTTANLTVQVNSRAGTITVVNTTYPDPSSYDLVVYDEDEQEIGRFPMDAQLFGDQFFYLHSASFIPNDIDVCNDKIRVRVVKTSESPDETVGKSDCISVSDTEVDPMVTITYSNNRNFAGLVYEDVSPAQEFSIVVPAVFFHERFPEEDEAIELSDSRIINLNGVVRAQRLLDTAYMPYYMHRKLKLIFKHNSVTVGDLAVTKQDAYEIEEGDRRWPVKKAKCWLTEKDFVQRNVV